MTTQQTERIKEIIKQWHEAGRADFTKRYTNLDYDSANYSKDFHVGAKYIRLDAGGSGAFMVEVESGIIYGIKAYGVPNKKKIAGVAWDPSFDGAILLTSRFRHGSFDNRKT